LVGLTAAVGAAVLGAAAVLAPSPRSDGLRPGADVPFYSAPWGKSPFFPGEIRTSDDRLANPQLLPSAADCGRCHRREFEEWTSSIHAVSGPDLIYETAADANEAAHRSRLGTEKVRWCESCHEPLLVLIGEVNPIPVVGPSDAALEGTTCIVCHTAVAADPEAGNAALVLAINEPYRYDDALIMAAPAEHARAMRAVSHDPLLGSSEFCGACHTEIRPPEINGGPPIDMQTTYSEWRDSGYAELGIQCQDCHMRPDPAAAIDAILRTGEPPPGPISHRFVGANYLLTDPDLPSNLVTFLRGGHPPGPDLLTTERWKADLRLQRAAILDLLQAAADLEIEAPATAEIGGEGRIAVTITNSGAGHDLPTGPLDQRHMWLEIAIADATGRSVYHSGWFDEERGEVDPEAAIYIKVLEDEAGRRINDHILFDVARYYYTRDPIPAEASDTVGYSFSVPEDALGPLSVEAVLWYRIALQDIVTFGLGLKTIVPPVEMARSTAEIQLP